MYVCKPMNFSLIMALLCPRNFDLPYFHFQVVQDILWFNLDFFFAHDLFRIDLLNFQIEVIF